MLGPYALSDAITARTSLRGGLFALSMTSLGWATYLQLVQQLKQAAEGSGVPDAFPHLDWRVGNTTEQQLAHMLDAYGPEGRRIYALAECVEVVFIAGYTMALCMALSAALVLSGLPHKALRVLNLAPAAAGALDLAENAALLAALASYPLQLPALTPYILQLNVLKWRVLYTVVALVAGTGVYCLYGTAKEAGQAAQQRGRARGAGTLEPGSGGSTGSGKAGGKKRR